MALCHLIIKINSFQMGNVSVNDKLKQYRLLNRLTQNKMAELLNITNAQYSKIETGKCQLNIHHIESMASNMGKKFTEIYNSIHEITDELTEEFLVNSNIAPTMEEVPNLNLSFELALQQLSQYCIKNNYIIHIQHNGDISFEGRN